MAYNEYVEIFISSCVGLTVGLINLNFNFPIIQLIAIN